jgi:hypothetical protein
VGPMFLPSKASTLLFVRVSQNSVIIIRVFNLHQFVPTLRGGGVATSQIYDLIDSFDRAHFFTLLRSYHNTTRYHDVKKTLLVET